MELVKYVEHTESGEPEPNAFTKVQFIIHYIQQCDNGVGYSHIVYNEPFKVV